ncbi:MAG: hypothetical protein M0Z46_20775 [Actinomycetota bacterium]|nr:hypothetical protein [Actinomycetota bacterium]
MAFPPILGRCRHCDADFSLAEVAERADGCCPNCGWILSSEYTSLLREQADVAYRAHQVLIASLRRLVGLPGNLEVLPHSVFVPLLDEIGWQEQLRAEPKLAQDELVQLRTAIAEWEKLSERDKDGQRAGLAARAQLLARRLRRIGTVLDARDGVGSHEGRALRDAASTLEEAGRRFAGDGTSSELDESVASVKTRTASALLSAGAEGEEQDDGR